MFKKIKILLIAFAMLFSNVAFSATSAYSLISQTNINKETKIDIVKQYRGIVNMPKVFCDICVELSQEIINISNKDKNNSSLNYKYTYNDNVVGNIKAIQNNNKKQTGVFFNGKKINLIDKDKPDKFLYYNGDNILYYITAYIGLLRANDVVNNNTLVNTGQTLLL
ncbi:hypothetical protein [Candidatus Ruminimicrobium bovinum]|uniref:hypothetical protein n=1 Tax=Candidatus Ruminimicrobium bovinum TaxID=3242779 RepID=UPI0039B9855D